MFRKHPQGILETIHKCLPSLPNDLPHAEEGMRVTTEAMDASDRTGPNERQRENAAHRRDQMIEKDAAVCPN